jgi:membrane-associated protein
VNDVLDWILATVQSVDPIVRTMIAGFGMLLETSLLVGLIVPGDTIVLVASTGVSNYAEYIGLLLAVIIGALCGESIGFAIGRYFGPKIMHSRLGRRIGEDHWMRAEHYIERRGGIAVFLSRFLPVLHSLVPVTVGASTMSYRRFIAWTAPACVIWAFMYVTVGALAADGYRQVSSYLHVAGYIFVGVIALFIVLVLVVKRVIGRIEARHMEHRDENGPTD